MLLNDSRLLGLFRSWLFSLLLGSNSLRFWLRLGVDFMVFIDVITFLMLTVVSSDVFLILLPVGFRVRRVLEIVVIMLNIDMDAIFLLFLLLVADSPELLVMGGLAGAGVLSAKVFLVVVPRELSAMSIGVSQAQNGLDCFHFFVFDDSVVSDSVVLLSNDLFGLHL